jgi:CheY-like chemotaxis protein
VCPQIIVIDDEPDFLESIRRGLITSGFKDVQLEKDPLQAIEIIEQGKDFDLDLIDVTMPTMNGLTLIKRIREDRKSLPIFLITAQADVDLRREAFRLNCEGFMEKPFTLEEIIREIDRVEILKQ